MLQETQLYHSNRMFCQTICMNVRLNSERRNRNCKKHKKYIPLKEQISSLCNKYLTQIVLKIVDILLYKRHETTSIFKHLVDFFTE